MPDWIEAMAARAARDEPTVLVTVAHASGSVPREAGSTMLVGRDDIVGSIGGGHLEFEAIRIARDALGNHANSGTWLVRFPLAARLGQCCGGVATLAFALMDRDASRWIDAARGDAPIALVSRIGGSPGDSAHLLVTDDRASGSLGSADLDAAAIPLARQRIATREPTAVLLASPAGDDATLLMNVIVPDAFTILLFGNGHVGRALAQVLGALPCRVRWIDSRESDFPTMAPANVEIVATDAPAAELADAPRGAYVLVMTHSHGLDFEIVEAALARDDWRYLGLIGSQSKRNQFAKRLAARGVDAGSAARVTCPIGAAPGIAIRSKEPGAIAVAVAAEILALREATDVRNVSAPSQSASATS